MDLDQLRAGSMTLQLPITPKPKREPMVSVLATAFDVANLRKLDASHVRPVTSSGLSSIHTNPSNSPEMILLHHERIHLTTTPDDNIAETITDVMKEHCPPQNSVFIEIDIRHTLGPPGTANEFRNHKRLNPTRYVEIVHPSMKKPIAYIEHHRDSRDSMFFKYVPTIQASPKYRSEPPTIRLGMSMVFEADRVGNITTFLEFTVRWATRNSMDLVVDTWEPCFFDYTLSSYHPDQTPFTHDDIFHSRFWPPQTKTSDFYDTADLRTIDNAEGLFRIEESANHPTRLFPFQRRSVRWLLNREGVDFRHGQLVKQDFDAEWISRFMGEPIVDYEGKQFYVNEYLAFASVDAQAVFDHHMALSGGILADEMGLGKTVELARLISLHRRDMLNSPTEVRDENTDSTVRVSPSTLIIMPLAIMEQWKNELAMHSPDLTVFEYEGTAKLRRHIATLNGKKKSDMNMNDIGNEELIRHLMGYDVVLCPFSVLAHEIHYTYKPPERSMRHEKQFERVMCPLVQMSWWRVCLDEAQMVESGVSQAAKVARMVPRVNAWAVTGTPVQKTVDDLHGLLVFLRLEPWASRKPFWDLLKSRTDWFKSLFGTISIRQTKDKIRNELRLPDQHRFVVSIAFTPVEEENYQALLEDMCLECKVDLQGNPIVPLEQPGSGDETAVLQKMRRWLVQLRQACIHPQIGTSNRIALGGAEGQVLKTASEVLDLMYDRNNATTRQDQRALLVSIVTRAQLTMEHWDKAAEGVELLERHIPEVQNIVSELRKELEGVEKEQKASGLLVKHSSGSEENEKKLTPHSEDENERVDEDVSVQTHKVSGVKARLNDFLEVEHNFYFLLGQGFFNLAVEAKKSEETDGRVVDLEEKENQFYGRAKLVRKELLENTQETVFRAIESLNRQASTQSFVVIPEVDTDGIKGGLETSTIIDNLSVLGGRLDEQADILDDWREILVNLLREELIDSEDVMGDTGEEFENAAHKNEEANHYVDIIQAMIADREAMISGIKSDRAIIHLKRITEFARLGIAPGGEPVANPDLLKKLLAEREKYAPIESEKPLRELVINVRSLITKLGGGGTARSRNELALAHDLLTAVEKIHTDQYKALTKLQKELNTFVSVTNLRLEFYRKVQQISDSLGQFKPELPRWQAFRPDLPSDPQIWIDVMVEEEKKLNIKLAQGIAKGRYLLHLKSTNSSADANELCGICRDPIEEGYVTVCGHIFCASGCLSLWVRERKSCPMCKRKITMYDMHRVTYKPDDVRLHHHGKTKADSSANYVDELKIYKGVNASLLNKIKSTSITESYGSKVDAIIRHLLFIRETEPGAKSVIFSQWKDALRIFEEALGSNGIGFASLQSKNGLKRFKQDPAIEVFLLHAKSQSAGLTLVNASHVFLCEPLVNTGLELQVIARVHRIGQTRETSVWLYTVRDSVEESVMSLSTRRRLEMLKDVGASTEGEDDFEAMLDTASAKDLGHSAISGMIDKVPGGGELVQEADLRECLFGNKRKRRHENEQDDNVAEPSRKRVPT